MPDGMYTFPTVIFPISKQIILPFVSNKTFSVMSSDLMRHAVPYLEAALFEITLKEELIISQLLKVSSHMLIS